MNTYIITAWIGLVIVLIAIAVNTPTHPRRLEFGTKRIGFDNNYEWWDGKHWLNYYQFKELIYQRAWNQEEELPFVVIDRMEKEYDVTDGVAETVMF